jgi:hypothetical protein
MTTWSDTLPAKPLPGTEPRPAWSRFFEALGLITEPDPYDRETEAGQ